MSRKAKEVSEISQVYLRAGERNWCSYKLNELLSGRGGSADAVSQCSGRRVQVWGRGID